MSLQNYRVTFGGSEINYKDDFVKCREYAPHVRRVLSILDEFDVGRYDRWFFFEPYAEITWIDPDPAKARATMQEIQTYLDEYFKNINFLTPDDGEVADWYFAPGNLAEREFGYRRHASSADQAELFYHYLPHIGGKGTKGLEQHYVRSCHVLANQLGLSYKDEGRLLFWRGVLCKLFWLFGHKKAVWIYTKIFRQKS